MSCRVAPTETVPYSQFSDYVRMHVTAIPSAVMEHAIRAACIEMASEGLNMQRDIWVDVQEGVQDYQFEVPGMVIHAVRKVCYGQRELTPVIEPNCDTTPGTFFYEPPNGLIIGTCPSEDQDECLYIRAVVHPSPDGCEVDRWVYERHAQAIAEGALSRLLLMKDMSWYDVPLAGVMFRRWKTARNRIKGMQAKNRISGPTMMRTKRFI